MSKFTADEVERAALWMEINIPGSHCLMLDDLARRLRQEEEENRRDPVKEPRPGDRVIAEGAELVWTRHGESRWTLFCQTPGATIIRRREVQQ